MTTSDRRERLRDKNLMVHRVLARHAPLEVCSECPQPVTDDAIEAARLDERLTKGLPR